MSRILVTYSWNRVGYGILRSLKDDGHYVVTADVSKVNICSWSKYVDKSYTYSSPFSKEERFIGDLLEIIQKEKIDVLIPTHDEGLVISKNRNEFPENLIVGVDEYGKILKMSNKSETLKLAKKLKIPVASQYSLSQLPEVEYPAVLRGEVGNSQKNVHVVHSIDEAHKVLTDNVNEKYILQSYFKGVDYCADVIKYGSYFKVIVFKALSTRDKMGGTTTRRVVVNNEKIENYCRLLVEYYNYNGVCGIDFMVNELTGDVIFLEINARYSGALAGSCLSGFNMPNIHVNLLLGKDFDESKIIEGRKTRWLLGELIGLFLRAIRFSLKPKDIREFLIFPFNRIDDLRKDDPKAFFGQILYYLLNAIKSQR